MKILLIIIALSVPVFACDQGCEAFKDGCACDAPKEKAVSVKPSEEKPRKGQQLPWETGEITPDMRPNLATQDSKIDEANTEGKRAAGL